MGVKMGRRVDGKDEGPLSEDMFEMCNKSVVNVPKRGIQRQINTG